MSGEGQSPSPVLSPEQLAELAKQLAPQYPSPVMVREVAAEPPSPPVPDAGDPASEGEK
jgi:hypothetical protein